MQDNERLFSQLAAPQEAVMDTMLIKHLSRLCRGQHCPVQAQGVLREAGGQHEGEGADGQPIVFVFNLKITERNISQQN